MCSESSRFLNSKTDPDSAEIVGYCCPASIILPRKYLLILLLPSRAHLSLSEPQLSLSSIPTRTSWRYSLETSTLALRSDLASDLHVILSHRHTNSRRHLRVLCECMCVSQCGWNQNPQVSRGISGEWGFVAYTQFPLNHAHSSFHNVHLQITLSSSGWG